MKAIKNILLAIVFAIIGLMFVPDGEIFGKILTVLQSLLSK